LTEAILLGSGGWIPTSTRATCCALLRNGDHAVVVDAGTGLGRLVEDPSLLDGVHSVDIVLTHFHLDHVVGLAYLPALPFPGTPRLHGPGAWLYGVPTAEILARLTDPPLFALGVDAMTSTIEEISGDGAHIGGFEVSVRVQERHNHPTVALRFGNELAYCTDTALDEGNAEFARGCSVLAHEAWCTEDERRDADTHTSAADAAQVARRAGVEHLVLIHIRPRADEAALLEEAEATFAPAVVGADLLRLPGLAEAG
jgi:ribonuclease BN (tRNA processing enzyme)